MVGEPNWQRLAQHQAAHAQEVRAGREHHVAHALAQLGKRSSVALKEGLALADGFNAALGALAGKSRAQLAARLGAFGFAEG
jgi:hypothetical protein